MVIFFKLPYEVFEVIDQGQNYEEKVNKQLSEISNYYMISLLQSGPTSKISDLFFRFIFVFSVFLFPE